RANLKAKGMGRAEVCAEEGGWRLLYVSDSLAAWAFGLCLGSRFFHPKFLLLEDPSGSFSTTEFDATSSEDFKGLASKLKEAPTSFRQQVIETIANFWESRKGYRTHAYLSILSETFGPEKLPWAIVAKKIA